MTQKVPSPVNACIALYWAPKMLSPTFDSWLGTFHYILIKSLKTENSPINLALPKSAQCHVPNTLNL